MVVGRQIRPVRFILEHLRRKRHRLSQTVDLKTASWSEIDEPKLDSTDRKLAEVAEQAFDEIRYPPRNRHDLLYSTFHRWRDQRSRRQLTELRTRRFEGFEPGRDDAMIGLFEPLNPFTPLEALDGAIYLMAVRRVVRLFEQTDEKPESPSVVSAPSTVEWPPRESKIELTPCGRICLIVGAALVVLLINL